jgi:hypothetical protein
MKQGPLDIPERGPGAKAKRSKHPQSVMTFDVGLKICEIMTSK